MAVVVSGGTRGIGLQIAGGLATPGATVARPVAVAMDAGTEAGADKLLAAVPDGEPVGQLVHCAVEVVPDPLLHLVRAALPRLLHGSLVLFLTSRGGRVVIPGYAAVSVGKARARAWGATWPWISRPGGAGQPLALGVLDTAAARTLLGERTAATLSARVARSPTGRGIEHFDYLRVGVLPDLAGCRDSHRQTVGVYGGAGLLG